MNEIISTLPFKKGIGANKDKECIDWISTVNIDIDIDINYYDNIYTLHILEYNKKKRTLIVKILNLNITREISISSFIGLKFGRILPFKKKLSQYSFKYPIDYTYKSSKSEMKIIKHILIPDKNGHKTCGYESMCLCCNYINTLYQRQITQKVGCPVCNNQIVVQGINDISTTDPDLIKYLDNPHDAYKYSIGVNKKLPCHCPECKYSKLMAPRTIKNSGFACPICSDNLPYNEKFLICLFNQLVKLNQIQSNYIYQYTADWSKNVYFEYEGKVVTKNYDFYIPYFLSKDGLIQSLIMENQGEQHSKDKSSTSNKFRGLDYEKANDEFKKTLATPHVDNYIQLDCSISDYEYIKDRILNSILNDLFDLTLIDWHLCNEFSTKTLVKVVCDYWNNNHSIKSICSLTKLSRKTVRLYLKRGATLGWCKYDARESIKESHNRSPRENLKKKIVCLETGEIFNSIGEAAKIKKANATCISQCISKKKSTSGGFHWMLYDDYILYSEDEIEKILSKDYFVINLDTGKCFYSIKDAKNEYNIKANITLCCQKLYTDSGEFRTAGGYRWMYYKDFINYSISEQNNLLRTSNN